MTDGHSKWCLIIDSVSDNSAISEPIQSEAFDTVKRSFCGFMANFDFVSLI